MKGKKQPSTATLKRTLDIYYSRWLRRSQANSSGLVTCYCGALIPWEESDCSHYHSRAHLSLRWDKRNTRPSCRRCNRFMGGNLQAYARALIRDYGPDILEELEREKKKIVKLSPAWYLEQIQKYKSLV